MDYRIRIAAGLVAILVAGLVLLMVNMWTTNTHLGEQSEGVRPASGTSVAPGKPVPTTTARSVQLTRPAKAQAPATDDSERSPVTWDDLPQNTQVRMSAVQGTVLHGVVFGCVLPHMPDHFPPTDLRYTTITGPEGLLELNFEGHTDIPEAATDCMEDVLWDAPWVQLDVDGELHQDGVIQLKSIPQWKRGDSDKMLEDILEKAQAVLDELEGAL